MGLHSEFVGGFLPVTDWVQIVGWSMSNQVPSCERL